MNRRNRNLVLACYILTSCWIRPAAGDESADKPARQFLGALLSADQATESRLRQLKSDGVETIALLLNSDVDQRKAQDAACKRIVHAELELSYWIEIARCPELADAHPELMASLQGHSEWRRLFTDPPVPDTDEVVKTYPWVPILNRQAFDAQLERVRILLKDRPQPTGIFLNDIQGAPSACGCGNHLCRWTSDYGKIRTATPLGDDAPAEFIKAVRTLLPDVDVIPVWTTECEEHDGDSDGLCAGVGCFKGICWKAWTDQLVPVAARCDQVGVMVPYKAFQRDLPIYGEEAGWVRRAVQQFETMPAHHDARPVAASRLITVLQGWDVTDAQITAQRKVAAEAGVAGTIVAYTPIDQRWEPRIFKLSSQAR